MESPEQIIKDANNDKGQQGDQKVIASCLEKK